MAEMRTGIQWGSNKKNPCDIYKPYIQEFFVLFLKQKKINEMVLRQHNYDASTGTKRALFILEL